MNRVLALLLLTSTVSFTSSACSTAPKSSEGRTEIRSESLSALNEAKAADGRLRRTVDASFGCAVFPHVGKGAMGVGGAYGKGVLYEGARAVGYCDLSQASVGLQLGAQRYTEILCFENEASFKRFKDGKFALDAQATAVALEAGAGASAAFSKGVAVFTTDETGLMVEASVGGQKFAFQAL